MQEGGKQAYKQQTGSRPCENRIGLHVEEIQPGYLNCGLRRQRPARHGASTEQVIVQYLNRRRAFIGVQSHGP